MRLHHPATVGDLLGGGRERKEGEGGRERKEGEEGGREGEKGGREGGRERREGGRETKLTFSSIILRECELEVIQKYKPLIHGNNNLC